MMKLANHFVCLYIGSNALFLDLQCVKVLVHLIFPRINVEVRIRLAVTIRENHLLDCFVFEGLSFVDFGRVLNFEEVGYCCGQG